MTKKNEATQWALWNCGRLFTVARTRRECCEYANGVVMGGTKAANQMFKSGAFTVSKVIVREI